MAGVNADRPHDQGAEEDEFAASSQAMVDMLTRVPTFEALLQLVCECARVDRAARTHEPRTPHLWLCSAGTFEFWLSRHPAETIAWLGRFDSVESLPPEPRW